MRAEQTACRWLDGNEIPTSDQKSALMVVTRLQNGLLQIILPTGAFIADGCHTANCSAVGKTAYEEPASETSADDHQKICNSKENMQDRLSYPT